MESKKHLKVWWESEDFQITVEKLRDAKVLLDGLAEYSSFKFAEKNSDYDEIPEGNLLEFDEESGEWTTWESYEGKHVQDLSYEEIDTIQYNQLLLRMQEIK